MPPNRKGNFDVVDGLATLSLDDVQPVATKYAPLTSASETNSAAVKVPSGVIQAPHVKDKSHPANSYWDWEPDVQDSVQEARINKEATIQRIIEEERIRQLLSADNVQNSLINEKKMVDAEKIVYNSKNVCDEVGYWDDVKHDDRPSVVRATHVSDPAHPLQSYWDWSAAPLSKEEQNKEIVKTILLEEKNRQLLSVQHTEELLIKQTKESVSSEESKISPENDSYWGWDNARLDTGIAPHTKDLSHPATSYWDWDTTLDKKDAMIQEILHAEKVRKLFMVSHIQEGLVKHCRENTTAANVESKTCFGDAAHYAGEPQYWDW